MASKYGEGLFTQLQRADGKMFNVSVQVAFIRLQGRSLWSESASFLIVSFRSSPFGEVETNIVL